MKKGKRWTWVERIVRLLFYGIAAVLLLALLWPVVGGFVTWARLRLALETATSVEVVEHSCKFDQPWTPNYQEVTYQTVTLTPKQVGELKEAMPVSFVPAGMLKCIFEEHHVIRIKSWLGTTTFHICFHCGQMTLGDYETGTMPNGWRDSLAKFFTSIGMHPDGPWPRERKGTE